MILRVLLLGAAAVAQIADPEPEVLIDHSDQIYTHLVDQLTGKEGVLAGERRNPNRWPLNLINSSAYWDLDVAPAASIADPSQADQWLRGYMSEAQQIFHIASQAGWNYFTNITHDNRESLVDAEEVLGEFLKATSAQARQFSASGRNGTRARLLRMLGMEGLTALAPDDFARLTLLQREIAHNFTAGSVCEGEEVPPCSLNWPAVQGLMATSRNPETLLYAWKAWHAAVGPDMREHFNQLAQLTNQGARLNGFADGGALWRSPFEDSRGGVSLVAELEGVWAAVRPFYEQLHAFVRRRLARLYAPASLRLFTRDGPIPAQFLGSMSGDTWLALFSDLAPFPRSRHAAAHPPGPFHDPYSVPPDPVTQSLYEKEYTAEKMFRDADAVFRGLGFEALPQSFWDASVLEHPFTRDVFCHPPTAFDLKDGTNFLVKMCAEGTKGDYVEAHRLLAHTHYQRAYRTQPLTFREGANPSVSQAVADAVGKYVGSQAHLASVGLLPPLPEPEGGQQGASERSVNLLMEEALEWVVSGPFSLVVDSWRWGLFDGSVAPDALNKGWWDARRKYQGVSPPEPRGEEFLDAAGNPQVATQQFPSVRRFLSYVLQFQILKSLCTAAGSTGRLDVEKCGLGGSMAAGDKLRALMSPGISRPWTELLEELTGNPHLDPTALLEYYEPLHAWLKATNEENGDYIGWDGPGSPFSSALLNEAPLETGNRVDAGTEGGEVALPGEPCNRGQFCLLESVCNGTTCVCREGFFPFLDTDSASTYCLEGDPESIGLWEEANGLEIEGTALAEDPEPESEPEHRAAAAAAVTAASSLLSLTALLLLCLR